MTASVTDGAPLLVDIEENTPLLSQTKKHELVYERFPVARKRAIVSMVSVCGLMPLFVGGTFVPCIPQIAKELNSDGATVSLAISISMFATSIGALVGSAYSGFYGRRPIYLSILPFSILGSIGVSLSTSIPQLLFWRFFQAFGVSPSLSVGAGVIGDIYKLEERGTAMGVFFAAILLGPAIAPLAGGASAHYSSWRTIQFILGVTVLLVFFAMLAWFPETSHPGTRGVDKVLSEDRDTITMEGQIRRKELPKWRPVILNPFASLWMLRSPALFSVATIAFLVLAVDYTLLVPISYTIGEKYGLTNEAWIGACFLPNGVGSMIGAPLAGRLSDSIVSRSKAQHGKWYPEDRLRAALIGAVVLMPGVFMSGVLTTYVDGTLGLVGNLVCLFLSGLGVDMVLSLCSAYVVDVMHSKSAESIAALSAFRAIILSIFIAGILPMIDNYGVLVTDALGAFCGLVTFGLLVFTIRNGEWLRGLVDVGFSSEENN